MLEKLFKTKEAPQNSEGKESLSPASSEVEKSIESKLHLREQYDQNLALLNKTGLLQILPELGSYGLVGLDGKEYPMPKYAKVLEKLEANKEKFENKMEQGFTKLLITPFAMPIDSLVERYKREIMKKHKEGKLLATKKNPKDPDEKLQLDTETPIYLWDAYKQGDEKGTLIYHPTSFSNKPGGKTKKELIEDGQAWDISLIEDLPNLPAEGRGETIKGRKQLEANKTPNDYLRLTQTDPNHKGETGFTPEQWLTYAITHLESTNQVIDDYQGNGKLAYLTGSYFPGSGYVPHAYWIRDYQQAILDRVNPGYRNSDYGVRVSVRV